MQILAFVLYSRTGERRDLSLKPGSLNIITGSSGTGKSALSTILDYCFGARDHEVAAGPIRDTVSWYGVLLEVGQGQLFVARKNPYPEGTTTGETFILEGDEVVLPESAPAAPNASIDSVKRLLEDKLGIAPNLYTPPEGQTRLPLTATVRHALTFCLQQQTEIVSPRYLFHGSENAFYAQAIRDTLPYFLGAIREDRLALEQDLRRARGDLRTARKRLSEAQDILGEGTDMAQSLIYEAKEVGLWDGGDAPTDIVDLRRTLEGIRNWTAEDGGALNPGRLREVQDEYAGMRRRLDDVTQEIKAAKVLAQEAEGYGSAQAQQQLRLESIGLFSNSEHDEASCPLCRQRLETTTPHVDQIRASLSRVRDNTERIQQRTPQMRSYIEGLELERNNLRRQLSTTQETIEGLYRENIGARRLRDANLRRSRTVGRITLWLDSVQKTINTQETETALQLAEARVAELEARLDRSDEEARLNSILNRINNQLSGNARRLELEHSDNPIRLDLRGLSVIADELRGPIPLRIMGSGKNWMGYNLALHFALHRHLVEQNRPVPRFLFLDQPSQVYYPRDQDETLQGSIDALVDEDRAAVRTLFQFMLEQLEALTPHFQVIITEHADLSENWFQENVVARWRGGEALIPDAWIAASSAEK